MRKKTKELFCENIVQMSLAAHCSRQSIEYMDNYNGSLNSGSILEQTKRSN